MKSNLRFFSHLLLAGFVLFCLQSCADAENPIGEAEQKPEVDDQAERDTAAPLADTIPERKFPLLTDENAEAFLLEYFKKNPERKIRLTTRAGTLKFRLFDDTPLHTANFLMLVKRGYFDNTQFTRVVDDFVVQGGNNDSETEEIKRILIGSYELPPEMNTDHFHKKGALSMARRYEENPGKMSAAYNFFFVEGRTFNEPQLMALEREHDMNIPPHRRRVYSTVGGAPHLDGEHTVFGEIYEGMNVLEKMSEVKTDDSDWPVKPLIMDMEVIDE